MTTPTTPGEHDDLKRPDGSGPPHAIERDGHARQCGARTRSGARCRSFAVEGMKVCRMHGGSSPQARRAAELRKAQAAATAMLHLIWDPDAPPIVDPITALQSLAGKLQHAANVLGARLATAELDGPTGLAFVRVMREFRQTLEGMERLDLAGKHIAMEQERAQMVVAAFLGAIELLHLAPMDRSQVVERFLAGLDTGGVPVVALEPAQSAVLPVMESAGRQIASVLQAVLARLDLTGHQQDLAAVVVQEELRRMGEASQVVPGEVAPGER